jgi:hypothetical protein
MGVVLLPAALGRLDLVDRENGLDLEVEAGGGIPCLDQPIGLIPVGAIDLAGTDRSARLGRIGTALQWDSGQRRLEHPLRTLSRCTPAGCSVIDRDQLAAVAHSLEPVAPTS